MILQIIHIINYKFLEKALKTLLAYAHIVKCLYRFFFFIL